MVRSLLPILFVLAMACGCQKAVQRTPSSSVLGIETTSPQLVDGVQRVDVQSTVIQHYSPADMDLIPIGAKCEVKLNTADRTLIGRVASCSTGTLVLADAEEITRHTNEQGVPMMANIPYVNRMFRNVGAAYSTNQIGSATISSFEIEEIKAHLAP